MPGGWACTFSGAPVIALLGPCLWLQARLHHSHSVVLPRSPASSLLLLTPPPPRLFLPTWLIMADPHLPNLGILYPHTHTHKQGHSAVFRAACSSDVLCAICYKTALLILFGREMETIARHIFSPLQLVRTDSFSSPFWLSECTFSLSPGPSTLAPAFCVHQPTGF